MDYAKKDSSLTIPLKPLTQQPDFGSQRPSEAVRGSQRQSGIRGALLRLVCPAPLSLYVTFSHLPRPIQRRQLAKESRPKKSL